MTTLPRRVRAVAVGIFALAAVTGHHTAYASTLDAGLYGCDIENSLDAPFVSGTNVTDQAASECQYLYPPNSGVKNTETTVNYWEFFGEDDWWQLSKTDLTSDVGFQSGTWEIEEPVNFGLYAYMIVFKDGADTNLIGFLLNGNYASGNWISPFVNPPFDVTGAKDVSNFAIYRAALGIFDPPPPPVPEPRALVLLGIGLFAVAAGMRRNRRRT
jgi:hypothetical protein